MDLYDNKNILQLFEKYKEFVDPEYLQYDIGEVDKLFTAFTGGGVGAYIHDKIVEHYKKNKQDSDSKDDS